MTPRQIMTEAEARPLREIVTEIFQGRVLQQEFVDDPELSAREDSRHAALAIAAMFDWLEKRNCERWQSRSQMEEFRLFLKTAREAAEKDAP